MLFVKAYPTSVCYLLQWKQPNKETKPLRQIPGWPGTSKKCLIVEIAFWLYDYRLSAYAGTSNSWAQIHKKRCA